ncbi:hypothetical protein PGB28_08460 [Primorskyibacter aestuariivivens]|uniref:hypothetical protein n=1 Tax=Primorskyibacter aestuariivivens TaxID=1888912 RepID=UPI002301BCDC|nr:hypothetical protein [Primorskyibacter aestuariivivens]MDA7428490.1 hypothetical protein [Primorskyibacter aestuariivivens]
MRATILLTLLFASPAFAESWVLRDSDTGFDLAALDARLRGEILTFYDGGKSEFYEDGRYTYTYADDGGTGYGYFEVMEDSRVCIEFVNGFSRCDAYVTDAQDRLVVITEAGDRFPVRE